MNNGFIKNDTEDLYYTHQLIPDCLLLSYLSEETDSESIVRSVINFFCNWISPDDWNELHERSFMIDRLEDEEFSIAILDHQKTSPGYQNGFNGE